VRSKECADLEGRTWLLPAERSKNGRERLTPLSDAALNVIASVPRIVPENFVFTVDARHHFALNYQAQAKPRDAVAFTQPWTAHDIRRTVATGLQKLGVELHVISAILGHVIVSGVGGIYQRHAYEREKAQALDAWAKHVVRNARGLRAVS